MSRSADSRRDGATSNAQAELARLAAGAGKGAQAARTALGTGPVSERLRAAILAFARHRGPVGSTCPSDGARAVGGAGWRELMAAARDIAVELAKAGEVDITQRGKVLNPHEPWRGPIRIKAHPSQLH